MDFRRRKLPKDATAQLRLCPVETVQPCTLMIAPAYVYMKLNEKYVMVKGALDFFDTHELERIKPLQALFFPEEVEVALQFRKAATDIRALLEMTERSPGIVDGGGGNNFFLAPAEHEIADAVLRVIAPLWGTGTGVEHEIDPFYVAVFSNELCAPLPAELLKETRDQDFDRYEQAVVGAGWAVFFALHLGYCNLSFLSRLREQVFREIAKSGSIDPIHSQEVSELIRVAKASLGETPHAVPGLNVAVETAIRGLGRASEKLTSRIAHIAELDKARSGAGEGAGDV